MIRGCQEAVDFFKELDKELGLEEEVKEEVKFEETKEVKEEDKRDIDAREKAESKAYRVRAISDRASKLDLNNPIELMLYNDLMVELDKI